MLDCPLCTRRYVYGFMKSLAGGSWPKGSVCTPRLVKPSSRAYGGRTATRETTGSSDTPEHTAADPARQDPRDIQRKDKLPNEVYRRTLSFSQRPAANTRRDFADRHANQQELIWLRDPMKLAQRVLDVLRKNDFDRAESLVHAASKSTQCTVSWNHLINWQMRHGKAKSAIRTYNDMKKRGQKPDAYTYTMLFTGLAHHINDYPHGLAKALSIYHSLDAANSPVKPNVIITNAALNVCARAKDMDALFGIVAKLGRQGTRAPDSTTFNIILNAMRYSSTSQPTGQLTPEESKARTAEMIRQARAMWDDIISRWRKGDLRIDEKLICSMGQILLLGEQKDIDDIFSLIEQTMNIKRLLPPLGTSERSAIEPSLQGNKNEASSGSASGKVDERTAAIVPHGEFQSEGRPGRSLYARPGPNSLSLVLDALYQLQMKKSLAEYWEAYTMTHKVVPDIGNYRSYLRILRLHRASNEAVRMVASMPDSMMAASVFQLAMAACVRNAQRESTFEHADALLVRMQQTLPAPDFKVLQDFLRLANTFVVPATAKAADREKALLQRGSTILNVADMLDSVIRQDAQQGNGFSRSRAVDQPTASATNTGSIVRVRTTDSARDMSLNNLALARQVHGCCQKMLWNLNAHGLKEHSLCGLLMNRIRSLTDFIRRKTQPGGQTSKAVHA